MEDSSSFDSDQLVTLLNDDSYSLLFSLILVNLSLSLLSYVFDKLLSLIGRYLFPHLSFSQKRMLSRRFAVVAMHLITALLSICSLLTLQSIVHPRQPSPSINDTLHSLWMDMEVKFIPVSHHLPRRVGLQGLLLCRNALLFDAALNLVDLFHMSSLGGREGWSSAAVNGATAVHHFACLVLVCAVFTLGMINPDTAMRDDNHEQYIWDDERLTLLLGYAIQISRVSTTLSVCGSLDLCLAPSTMSCLIPELGTQGNDIYAYICVIYALISVLIARFGYANLCAYFVIASATAEFDEHSLLVSGVLMISLFFLWIYWSQLARAMWSLFTTLIIVSRQARSAQENGTSQFLGPRQSSRLSKSNQNKKKD